MEKLVILDYGIGTVDIFDIPSDIHVDEEYIQNLGFRLNDISWMLCPNLSIHFNNLYEDSRTLRL